MKFKFLLMMIGIFLLGNSYAQTGLLKGKVSDENGSAIPGVTVKIKGASGGVATDGGGTFQINAPRGSVLIISAIGYGTKEIAVTNQQTLNISLLTDNQQLNEVVVTALGVKRDKRTLTYSTQQLNAQEITNTRENNVVNALTGKVSGVQITSSTGSPGASSRIVIRGATSATAENQALFVVDGVPINNSETGNVGGGAAGAGVNRAVDIDPSTIESINILKGAAASALYGSAGARGVVLITTKSGALDKKPVISLSSNFSFEKGIFPEIQTKYAQGTNGVYYNGEDQKTGTVWGPPIDGLMVNGQQVPTYNPFDFYQTGHTTNNVVSVAGGGKTSDYYISYSFLNQTGIIPKADFTRHSFFAKHTTHINEKLTNTFQMTYSNSEQNRLPEGASNGPQFVIFMQPLTWNPYPVLNPDGSQRLYRLSRNAPLWTLDHINNRAVVNRFIPINTLVYKPLSWLSITERLGADIYTEQVKYTEDPSVAISLPGQIRDQNSLFRQFNNDLIVNAEHQFGKFNVNLLLGNNFYSSYSQTTNLTGTGLVISDFTNVSAGSTVTSTEGHSLQRKIGFYAQANIDYNKFLILSMTGRYDGASVLSPDKQFYSYGSVATSLILSELLPASVNKVMNFSKIRLSYAAVGNEVIGPYNLLTPYTRASRNTAAGSFPYPYNGQPGFLISGTYGNPNLKNEKLNEYEAGLELKFFNSRIGFEGSYFDRKSLDGIIPSIGISNATGYASTSVNTASIRNRGFELLLTGAPVRTPDFGWDVTFNFTKIKSKVLALAPGVNRLGRVIVGEPYNVFFGNRYLRDENGTLLITDAGLPAVAPTQGIVGDPNPDWLAGINNSIRYKNFTLNFFFDMKKGGDIQNDVDGYAFANGTTKVTENRDPRVVPGLNVNTRQPNTVQVTGQQYYQSLQYESTIQDGTYIKLRQLGLTYSLAGNMLKKTPFSAASFSVTGRNLWIYSLHFSGADPESNSLGSSNGNVGIYSFATPTSRSIDFALRLSF
jgi:TonB-linked SusC/RagA family outer membrane protein